MATETETATMTAATMTMKMKETVAAAAAAAAACLERGAGGSAVVAASARRWLRNRIKGTPMSLFSETHHVCPLQIQELSPQRWW